jgi:uncharacterized protein (TIGR02186 family)
MRALVLALLLLASPAQGEQVVAGVSQARVAITANFDGSEILVYGAIARDAPGPQTPPDVIVTIEGPAVPVTVRRKSRFFGIWINTSSVRISSAPAFYAIATTGPIDDILSDTSDLRHKITIGRAIRAVGAAAQADDSPAFTEALIRLQKERGDFSTNEGAVHLEQATLFRTDVVLPANLTEGLFRARIFLLRDGEVIDVTETTIDVHKDGIERVLHRLAFDQPVVYGLLALLIAAFAGWGASAVFGVIRR